MVLIFVLVCILSFVFYVALTYTLKNGGVDEFLKHQSTLHRSHRSCLCFSGSSYAGFERGEFSEVIDFQAPKAVSTVGTQGLKRN